VTFSDFLRLPPAVQITFVVMLWPAIWAAVALIMALVTDFLRAMRRHGAFAAARSRMTT